MKGYKSLHLFYAKGADTVIRVSSFDDNADNRKERTYVPNNRNLKRIQRLVNNGDVITSHLYDENGSSLFVYNR